MFFFVWYFQFFLKCFSLEWHYFSSVSLSLSLYQNKSMFMLRFLFAIGLIFSVLPICATRVFIRMVLSLSTHNQRSFSNLMRTRVSMPPVCQLMRVPRCVCVLMFRCVIDGVCLFVCVCFVFLSLSRFLLGLWLYINAPKLNMSPKTHMLF